tara:strand:+ start:494 stop:1063 length:570 start_codon:yes stop_codon:yes gene_type:complete
MSSSLGYSLIEGYGNQPKIKNNNSTRKHYPKKKVTLESMENQENNVKPLDENEDSDDNNWNPPPRAELTQTRDNNININSQSDNENDDDEPSLNNDKQSDYSFQPQENQYNMQYQNNNMPQYFQENFQANGMQPESDLNQKINYMIQLLEEQHDEKVKSVTEEVILYGFLGVFIIYIVDGFAKIGKYVR